LPLSRHFQHVQDLAKRIELDQPVNLHFTGCPNSCAQHYLGDIGCLGTKANAGGESVAAFHVFVGAVLGRTRPSGV
jgi:ferredoxin-nitrite reductase